VLALIGLLGMRVGVPTLQALCPELARREIQDLLRRYRRLAWRRGRLLARTLRWTRPGSVWAADFSEPPLAIEGCFTRLLAVRDLASGYQMLWLPVTDESAATAMAGLEALFHQYGAPLVLKSDNGSAFGSEAFAALLRRWGVLPLFSPPRMPRYNGSCEAGIGSMKARRHHQAARRGCAGEWTCDDAEAARLEANQTARPWGSSGPTPEEAWQGHQSIQEHERLAFAHAVKQREQEARRRQGYATDSPLDRMAQAAINRVAIRGALVAQGLLRMLSGVMSRRG
jgi:transposase InsO family protein